MKNGIFKTLTGLVLGLALVQLSGCATWFDLGDEDAADYDRGYAAGTEDSECTGRFCDTETESDAEYRRPAGKEEKLSHVRRAIETRDVILGMSRQEVLQSWGEPVQREVAGNGSGGHERWTYGSRYSFDGSRTVIFEEGRVAGWRR